MPKTPIPKAVVPTVRAPRLPLEPEGRMLVSLLDRQAYENWLVQKTVKELGATFRDISAKIHAGWPRLSAKDQRELPRLASTIHYLLTEHYSKITSITQRELFQYGMTQGQLAVLHAEMAAPAGMIEGAGSFQRIAPKLAEAIQGFEVLGVPLGTDNATSWFSDSVNNLTRAARVSFKQGMMQGEGIKDLTRRLVGLEKGTVERAARRSMEMFVRTAVNAVHSNAHFAAYQALPNGLTDEYVWVSTLDERTSETCIALADTVHKYNDPDAPRPPAHLNCRSTIVPLLKTDGKHVKDGVYSRNGVPDMERWLKEQPESAVRAQLGATRADLWLSGRMTLKEILTDKNTVRSVAQLREQYALPGTRAAAQIGPLATVNAADAARITRLAAPGTPEATAMVEGLRAAQGIAQADKYNVLGLRSDVHGFTLAEAVQIGERLQAVAPDLSHAAVAVRSSVRAEGMTAVQQSRAGKRIDIFIGKPGAGKSSLIKEVIDKRGSYHLDQDGIAEKMPGYMEGLGRPRVQADVVRITGDITKAAFDGGHNLVWEGTGKTVENLKAMIATAKSRGYTVNLHLVELPDAEAAKRVGQRFVRTGRPASPGFLESVNGKPTTNFQDIINLKEFVDGYARYDSNVPRGTRPITRIQRLAR